MSNWGFSLYFLLKQGGSLTLWVCFLTSFSCWIFIFIFICSGLKMMLLVVCCFASSTLWYSQVLFIRHQIRFHSDWSNLGCHLHSIKDLSFSFNYKNIILLTNLYQANRGFLPKEIYTSSLLAFDVLFFLQFLCLVPFEELDLFVLEDIIQFMFSFGRWACSKLKLRD